MKVPKSIKILIHRAARHHEIANKANKEVREWMEINNLYNSEDDSPAGEIDAFIDLCELTNQPELFIKHLEEL